MKINSILSILALTFATSSAAQAQIISCVEVDRLGADTRNHLQSGPSDLVFDLSHHGDEVLEFSYSDTQTGRNGTAKAYKSRFGRTDLVNEVRYDVTGAKHWNLWIGYDRSTNDLVVEWSWSNGSNSNHFGGGGVVRYACQ